MTAAAAAACNLGIAIDEGGPLPLLDGDGSLAAKSLALAAFPSLMPNPGSANTRSTGLRCGTSPSATLIATSVA